MAVTRASEGKRVARLIEAYDENLAIVDTFLGQLNIILESTPTLMTHIHSTKARLKDREHLREKLFRKLEACREEGKSFNITPENLLTSITDLAGIRLLHLYTRQIANIDSALREVFDENRLELFERPFARTWDDESKAFFESCGIEAQTSPTMYTSVHYVVSSASRTTVTCEIQVRTLMEEVWGEVDHAINYPKRSDVLASTEQLKVLARVTSSATRLVDSIFLTHEDAGKRR